MGIGAFDILTKPIHSAPAQMKGGQIIYASGPQPSHQRHSCPHTISWFLYRVSDRSHPGGRFFVLISTLFHFFPLSEHALSLRLLFLSCFLFFLFCISTGFAALWPFLSRMLRLSMTILSIDCTWHFDIQKRCIIFIFLTSFPLYVLLKKHNQLSIDQWSRIDFFEKLFRKGYRGRWKSLSLIFSSFSKDFEKSL